jgi:hydroxymethylpyrimidine kinase/phosphomethylpyrimidine kinase
MLAIGGLDPSGGAGLPADARAAAAFGVHCCGITTAVIAQNTRGVAEIEPVSPALLAAQLDNLLEDITPRAVKIGVLPNAASAQVVLQRLRQMGSTPLIIDTVFAPSSGPRFADEATVCAIVEHLLPLAEVVTPNIPEAEKLLGAPIADRDAMRAAAQLIHDRYGARHVLLKGGHLPDAAGREDIAGDAEVICDALDIFYDGKHVIEMRLPRVIGSEVRGTGCMLASAIAALRARDVAVLDAAWRAKAWLTEEIKNAGAIGQGRRVAVPR